MPHHDSQTGTGSSATRVSDAPFGFWTLTFLVVANMVGAGVFTTSGFALDALTSPNAVVLAWLAAGGIALTGAISYGMLIRQLPESGGEYLFLSRAVHPWAGFLAGWISLIAGFSGAIAFAATALESYLAPAIGAKLGLPHGTIATASVLLAALIHGMRVRLGAWLQNLAVILKLALCGVFLGYALRHVTSLSAPTPIAFPGSQVTAFLGSLVWISLSYSGFNAAVYLAEEARDARTLVPRALVTGTGLVLILYLALNAVFVLAVPTDEVRGREDVAAAAAQFLGGESLTRIVRGVIVLALWTSVSSMMMAGPRVYAKMAADGVMPRWLTFRGERPWPAIVAQAVIAIALVWATSLRELLSYLGLTLSLSAAGTAACLFLPNFRPPPGSRYLLAAPVIFVSMTLVTATALLANDPWQAMGTLATVMAGGLAYGFLPIARDRSRA